jgi:hypothetical protein
VTVYLYYNTLIPQSVKSKGLVYISHGEELYNFFNRFFINYKSVLFGLLFLTGCYFSFKRKIAAELIIWCFIYVVLFLIFTKWYPWYYPPFIFVYWIIITIGIDGLIISFRKPGLNNTYILYIILLIPIVLTLDTVSKVNVQKKSVQPYFLQTDELANWLNENVGRDEKILLEPLGRIGYVAFNKTFADYPGIVSKEVTNSLSGLGRKIWGSPMDDEAMKLVIADVNPEVLILRETEYRWLKQNEIIDKYSLEFVSYLDTTVISKNVIAQDMYILKSKF